MKKFRMIAAALALVLALPLTACGQKESESTVYSIGISQYGEHASLDNCRIGFLQGLEEARPGGGHRLHRGLPERRL